MGWFGNKEGGDPLAARERELEQEIARLSRQVEHLAQEKPKAVVRPTGIPPESPAGSRTLEFARLSVAESSLTSRSMT